ncbi:MAG: PrsW family intramembrane metalloprotease [Planctomycetes bacterium]|nr:PrsW family intramembrane metalloprotease [Planctomycetota bacterium]
MQSMWYFANGGQRTGPIALEELVGHVRAGRVAQSDLVWTAGMPAWRAAAEVAQVWGSAQSSAANAPPPLHAAQESPPAHRPGGFFKDIAAQISDMADLPTISDVPIRGILLGGLGTTSTREESIEDVFAAGVPRTTPRLAEIPSGWPRPRAFWHILLGAMAAYALLVVGATVFGNPNFWPGVLVVGSFATPLAVVVLFLELNAPRNVSIYQVGRQLLLGGALSLIAVLVLGLFVPSGTGRAFPAFLTGLVEESAKLLPLLWIARDRRYTWQMNGLLFGAAVGAGFAGFESAGYAFIAVINEVSHGLNLIQLRGLLAPGGHVIWCALVGAALWRVKGNRAFELQMLFDPVVLKRLAVVIVLHGLWDTDLGLYVPFGSLGLFGITPLHIALILVGWYLIFGALKQSLREVEEARLRAVPTDA